MDVWIESEVNQGTFPDKRLNDRFAKVPIGIEPKSWRCHSNCLSGLGGYQGGLSVLQ